MSSARANLLDSKFMADIDALDLSLGKQRSLNLAPSGAATGSGDQRLRRVGRYKTSICIKMPIIQEVDESHCEDAEQFATSSRMPSDRVDASAKDATTKAMSRGPFADAVASGTGPSGGSGVSYRDEKLAREPESILQSLRGKLNL